MLQKKNRIDALQILRAIAFLEIFLGHCGISFFTGAFGVSIFVVLSGFCMALNYLPKAGILNTSIVGNIKFAVSKIKKLYGLHLFMLLLAFLLAKMPTSKEAVKRLVMDVFLLQSLSPHAEDFFSYNGVAWYLSTYLFICIFSLWMIKLLSKIKNKKVVATAVLLVYAVMITVGFYVTKFHIPIGDNFAFWLTYISPAYRVLEFFVGAALGWFYLNREKNIEWKMSRSTILEVFTVIIFAAVIKIFHRTEGIYDGICYTALFTPVSLWLVIVFVNSRGLLMKLWNNRFFLWLGNRSSYMFLIHQVIIYWLMGILAEHFAGMQYRVLLTVLSFWVSAGGSALAAWISDLKQKKAVIKIDNYC